MSSGRAPHVLPALRSLSRAGWWVGVGQPGPGLATRSRDCSAWHRVPRAEDDVERFLAVVADLAERHGYEVVFPGDDVEVLALSEGRAVLPAVVPYPAHDVVLRALDKLTLTQAAASVGLPTPRTAADVESVAGDAAGPLVVKPRLHWAGGADASRHLPVTVAGTSEQAVAAVAGLRAAGASAVVQEFIDGELCALSVVRDPAGRLLAVSQQESSELGLRRTSTRAHTVPVDESLLAPVRRLLRELDWCGLANLQFLRVPHAPPRLIDLNPRFYGSLALAVSAGADLPAVWAAVSTGRDPGPPALSRPGTRFSSLEEDVARVFARSSSRPRDLVSSLTYAAGAAHSRWDPRDPLPLLIDTGVRVGALPGRAASGAGAAAVTWGRRLRPPGRGQAPGGVA